MACLDSPIPDSPGWEWDGDLDVATAAAMVEDSDMAGVTVVALATVEDSVTAAAMAEDMPGAASMTHITIPTSQDTTRQTRTGEAGSRGALPLTFSFSGGTI